MSNTPKAVDLFIHAACTGALKEQFGIEKYSDSVVLSIFEYIKSGVKTKILENRTYQNHKIKIDWYGAIKVMLNT